VKTFDEAVDVAVKQGSGSVPPEVMEHMADLGKRYEDIAAEVINCERLAKMSQGMISLVASEDISMDQFCISLIMTGIVIGMEMEKS
jgi:hypothetical protein